VVAKCLRPPLWSSGQGSWLEIQRSGFREVVGMERGPLSLVSKIEDLLGRKQRLRSRKARDPSRSPRGTIHPQKLALTLSTSGGSSVGIVR
jgi:hypothetical protein